MDQIETPDDAEWSRRRDWFEALFDIEKKGGAYTIGEQALGLVVDLQAVFCAGAYISVVIVACTIIDAHLREIELSPTFSGGMRAAFSASTYGDELEWLRRRRNEIVHFDHSRAPAITVEDHWNRRAEHEVDARRAIQMVAGVLLESPWV